MIKKGLGMIVEPTIYGCYIFSIAPYAACILFRSKQQSLSITLNPSWVLLSIICLKSEPLMLTIFVGFWQTAEDIRM